MSRVKLRRLGAIALLASVLATSASAEMDKLAIYTQMQDIAQQIRSLRGQPAERAHMEQLQAEFDALSASMGGDDPTNMRESSAASAGGATPQLIATAIIPPPPTGFTVTTTSVTNSTPLAIPTGPAVVSSTILISGAGPYLWDVDVSTFLTHTFSADLDITIQSPSGTVVTLTTDNGAGNDNTFNGTVWDDQAGDPVTDHNFVNLTPALHLSPEEALGAFRGENPNGTWTITISDDLAGDGGSLDSWGLDIHTLPAAPVETTTSFSTNTVTPIADASTITSNITVSGMGTRLTSVDLTTFITHTFAADLDITITSPAGTIVKLTTDNGAGNDDVFNGTNWNDKANPGGQVPYTTNNGLVTDHAYVNATPVLSLVPEQPLSAFLGEDPNGVWTISITDDLAINTGSLNGWTLNITTGIGIVAPVFDYSPAPAATVSFSGGGLIGSTGTASIVVSVATPGSGTGAASTTTTTCTAPGAPFSGFGQTVTAEGVTAISGGPLAGSCVLGAAPVTQTLTCSENQGGVPVVRTFELSCPAGTVAPLSSAPLSGNTITLPSKAPGTPATTATLTFSNPGLVSSTVTCVAPVATQFTVSPLVFAVPAGNSAATTISFNSPVKGNFSGVLNCSADSQNFSFNLSGASISEPHAVPLFGDMLMQWLIMASLLIGMVAYRHQARRD